MPECSASPAHAAQVAQAEKAMQAKKAMPAPAADRFVGEGECQQLTSLSRTTRWRMERKGTFPKRVKIAPNRIAWRLSEILLWAAEQPPVAA